MPLNLTYGRLDPRQIITAKIWNQTMVDLENHLNGLTGADLEAPLVLGRASQNLDGDDHYIHSFSRWFGHGNDVSVRDVVGFGAVGNGSDDDWGSIMDAIDDLPSTGGVVFFPPGTYIVTDTIQMKGRRPDVDPRQNVTLVGSGRGTVLKLEDDTNKAIVAFGKDAENMVITNLKLDGNDTAQDSETTQSLLDCSLSNHCTASQLWIENSVSYGILVDGASNLSILDCFMRDLRGVGIRHTEGRRGTGLTISNVSMSNIADTCIYLQPCPEGTLITKCMLSLQIANLDGIKCSAGSNSKLEGLSIVGNNIQFARGNGISVLSPYPNMPASGVLISKNSVEQSLTNGILVEASDGGEVYGICVSGNYAHLCGEAGIKLVQCKHSVVSGNVAQNNETGIYLDGIEDGESQYVSINGNTCFDSSGILYQDYGIRLSANTKNCEILGNAGSGNLTALILDEGTDNDIGHNPGYP